MDRAAPQPPEPAVTRFDLRGRLFGTPLRIHPLFWPAAAAVGWKYYAWPDVPYVGLFFLWLLCVMVSLLVHDLGHLAVGRLFGVRLGTVWHGLGSRITSLETLPRRPQRLAVCLAGPLAQLAVYALLWFFLGDLLIRSVAFSVPLLEWVASALGFFMQFTLVWALLNLLPIWPLDGGLFFWEWCAGLFGRTGPMISLVVCIFVAAGLGLMFGNWLGIYSVVRFDPRGSVSLQEYAILLSFCVFFVISAFRALRAEYRLQRGSRPTR